MKLQQVLSYVRKAVDDYHMIEEGDKIQAVRTVLLYFML